MSRLEVIQVLKRRLRGVTDQVFNWRKKGGTVDESVALESFDEFVKRLSLVVETDAILTHTQLHFIKRENYLLKYFLPRSPRAKALGAKTRRQAMRRL